MNKELEAAAQALGVILQMLRAHASEIDKAFLAMTEAQADATPVMAYSQYLQHLEAIIRHAANHRNRQRE